MINILHRSFKWATRVFVFCVNNVRFLEYHFNDTIIKPIILTPKCIEMKQSVTILHHARIEGVFMYVGKQYTPRIVFNKGVSIQQNLHLTCANSIVIGENTAIAANVTITDIHHSYTDIDIPIEQQEIKVKSVEIGADCKIYNNAVILPGTKIGKHVTVGANSVVSGIIPDYCVIAGSPAHFIKRYDKDSLKWRETDKMGNFNNSI